MTESQYPNPLHRIRFCDEHWWMCSRLGKRDNWQVVELEPVEVCGAYGCGKDAIWIEKPFTAMGEVEG